jgi:hypothetical protein
MIMKNLFTIILLLAFNMVNAQYFQQRFNLNYAIPKFRSERCNSGIVTRDNLAGGNPASYYFAGIGASYNDTSLKPPDNVADRMRFIQLNNVGTAVITDLGYQFSDVAGTPPFHSYGNSIAEVKSPNFTGGYVTVGEIKNNKITGANGIAGGSDALFTHLNAAGAVLDAVRYDVRGGSDRAWCIRKSVITSGGQPTWIICGESRQGTSNTICFVARVLVNGTIVWFNAYSFDPSGGAFNTSINIAKQLCEDTQGNIYVVGTLQDVPVAATGIDGLAFKLTPAGAVVWANSYHAASDDEFQAVRFAADGNIIVGGFTNFGAAAPVTSHMLIAKLSSATGLIIFENVLVESLNGNTYTSKCYDIIETAGPQYYLSGPGILNNNIYETMYRTNAAGFGINWYRYNRMNYNVGFGLDNSDTGAFRGIAYFSSMRNPDTPRVSDSHIMKTNYNGQTCKFCKAFPPKYLQVNLQVYPRKYLAQQDAQLRKLAWQAFNYSNIFICNDTAIHCNGAALSDVQDSSEITTVKAATVQISPNPVSSTLHLQFKNIKPGNYDIVIVNRQGSIVLEKTNVYCDNTSPVNLNVAQLFAGFYLIRISSGTNTIEQKVLKE